MVTCYMCDAPATQAAEHAPPKCFFPEKKDLPKGIDLRKNLITVPSCDTHNLKKSKDDEYLLFVVISHFQNNNIAARQFITKIMRAMATRPSLRHFYTATLQEVEWNGAKTHRYMPNWNRVIQTMECIARALYFNHYKERWTVPILIDSPGFISFDRSQSEKINRTTHALAQGCDILFKGEAKHGDNPEVFYYQIHRDSTRNVVVLRMMFYEGLPVVALSADKLYKARKGNAEQLVAPDGR